jgi:hypothetical protein
MIKFIKNQSLKFSAIVTISVLGGAENSFAATNFSTISTNVSTSIASLPGLLAGVSYMIGILLGVLGILKIKDHVENPTQTPLQHGAIRLVAGGGLFALPIVFEAMQGTIDNGAGTGVTGPTLTGIGTGLL